MIPASELNKRPEYRMTLAITAAFARVIKQREEGTGQTLRYVTTHSTNRSGEVMVGVNQVVGFELPETDGIKRVITTVFEGKTVNRKVYVDGQAIKPRKDGEKQKNKAQGFGEVQAPIFTDALDQALGRAYDTITSWTEADLR